MLWIAKEDELLAESRRTGETLATIQLATIQGGPTKVAHYPSRKRKLPRRAS
jgi:hypothetical protein